MLITGAILVQLLRSCLKLSIWKWGITQGVGKAYNEFKQGEPAIERLFDLTKFKSKVIYNLIDCNFFSLKVTLTYKFFLENFLTDLNEMHKSMGPNFEILEMQNEIVKLLVLLY